MKFKGGGGEGGGKKGDLCVLCTYSTCSGASDGRVLDIVGLAG